MQKPESKLLKHSKTMRMTGFSPHSFYKTHLIIGTKIQLQESEKNPSEINPNHRNI